MEFHVTEITLRQIINSTYVVTNITIVVCYAMCIHCYVESQEVVTTWHNIMAANPNVVKFLSNFVNKGYVAIT